MLARSRTSRDMEGLGLEAFMSVGLRSYPDRLCLREAARRAEPDACSGANLSFSDLDLRSRRLASLLSLSRLPERSQALILAPNGSEQLIAMFGALRAGLKPFLMPLSASVADLQGWLDSAGPAIAIGTGKCGDLEPAKMLRDAAARSFNARLVCAFGTHVPDGAVPLDNVITGTATLPPAPVVTSHASILTVSAQTSQGFRQVMMETDIVAASVDVARFARLANDHRVLSLMMSPSLCALATGPYLALLTGAEYLPLGLFSLSALWAGLSDGKPTALVAPAALEGALRAAGIIGHDSVSTVVLIHPAMPTRMAARPGEPGRICDIHSGADNQLTLLARA